MYKNLISTRLVQVWKKIHSPKNKNKKQDKNKQTNKYKKQMGEEIINHAINLPFAGILQ